MNSIACIWTSCPCSTMCYCEYSELNAFHAVHVHYNYAREWGQPVAVHFDCTHAHWIYSSSYACQQIHVAGAAGASTVLMHMELNPSPIWINRALFSSVSACDQSLLWASAPMQMWLYHLWPHLIVSVYLLQVVVSFRLPDAIWWITDAVCYDQLQRECSYSPSRSKALVIKQVWCQHAAWAHKILCTL